MFGRKKLIEENLKLKNKIKVLEINIKHYEEKEKAMLNGEHFPDATCKGCKYLNEKKEGYCTNRYCVLNRKCKEALLLFEKIYINSYSTEGVFYGKRVRKRSLYLKR